jgi:hypothetical protein
MRLFATASLHRRGRYLRMPHSFSQIYIHLVFGTKYRHSGMPREVRAKLYEFMAAVLNNL